MTAHRLARITLGILLSFGAPALAEIPDSLIHVPPPPPNQIVYVKTAEPFMVRELYTPVWVTGRMSTKSSTRALFFVDGTADIDVGYALRVEDIQPYE